MRKWVEILDHGDDPGRYTIIRGDGRICTCNATGEVIFRRRCKRPDNLVYELRREPGVGIVPPKRIEDLLKRFALTDEDKTYSRATNRSSSIKEDTILFSVEPELETKLLTYAKMVFPQGDTYTVRKSLKGNYVLRVTNDYPLQHGPGCEWTLTPEQVDEL